MNNDLISRAVLNKTRSSKPSKAQRCRYATAPRSMAGFHTATSGFSVVYPRVVIGA